MLEDLGFRIRERREARGLKQHDLANALQVSPQAVSKWERGENAPDIAVLSNLATLLGVSTDWLLGRHQEALDLIEGTVLFSSVSGAFEKSLEMDPRDFAAWANGVFFQVTQAVLRFDAVPIKYMGDQFLCFFSGPGHADRAIQAAQLAREMTSEALKIGLSSGSIYVGSVGHPDYARPDIMGQTVNAAYLTMQWAEEHTRNGMAATQSTIGFLDDPPVAGRGRKVNLKGSVGSVVLHALKSAS